MVAGKEKNAYDEGFAIPINFSFEYRFSPDSFKIEEKSAEYRVKGQ